MKNFILTLALAAFSTAAEGAVIKCQNRDGDGAHLASFKFDPKTGRGTGHYDNMDEGQLVSLSLVSAEEQPGMIEIRVNEIEIAIWLNTEEKSAVAFEANESNPNDPFKTTYKCR